MAAVFILKDERQKICEGKTFKKSMEIVLKTCLRDARFIG